jgi:hypothetical protein
MTVTEQINSVLADSEISKLGKIVFIVVYWILKQINDTEMVAFALQAGYTFTIPENTESIIFADGETSYTVNSLLTATKQLLYSTLPGGRNLAKMSIKDAHKYGWITDDQYADLELIPW